MLRVLTPGHMMLLAASPFFTDSLHALFTFQFASIHTRFHFVHTDFFFNSFSSDARLTVFRTCFYFEKKKEPTKSRRLLVFFSSS